MSRNRSTADKQIVHPEGVFKETGDMTKISTIPSVSGIRVTIAAISTFLVLSVSLIVLAQKPTLSDVEAALKKAENNRASVAKLASDAQKASERAAANRAITAARNAAVDQYKQEERFVAIENGLKEVQQAKAAEVKKAEEDRQQAMDDAKSAHVDLMKTVRNSLIGLFCTLFGGLSMMWFKGLADRQHQRATKLELSKIHRLVDGGLTASKQETLDAKRGQLVALQEIVAMRREQGATPSTESIQLIAAYREKIDDLQREMDIRLASVKAAEAEGGHEGVSNAEDQH